MSDDKLPSTANIVDPEKAQEIEDLCRKCINELNNAEKMIDQISAFQQKGNATENQGPERTWENKTKTEKLDRLNNIKNLLNDAITKINALLTQILQLSKGLKFGTAHPGIGQGSSSNANNDEDNDEN